MTLPKQILSRSNIEMLETELLSRFGLNDATGGNIKAFFLFYFGALRILGSQYVSGRVSPKLVASRSRFYRYLPELSPFLMV